MRVRVWRDDLAKIISLIEQVNPKYTITADDFELESLDDLDDLERPQLSRFSIKTTAAPEIEFTLSPEGSFIAATNPDVTATGVVTQIDRVMRVKTREPVWLFLLGLAGLVTMGV